MEDENLMGELAAGMLTYEGRKFGCIAKKLSYDSDASPPRVVVAMEEGQDLPVFQRIKNASGSSQSSHLLQFIRSVPNSRIWAREKGFSIMDADRMLAAQLVIDDSDFVVPEHAVALIHLRHDLDRGVAQELVATLIALKFAKD